MLLQAILVYTQPNYGSYLSSISVPVPKGGCSVVEEQRNLCKWPCIGGLTLAMFLQAILAHIQLNYGRYLSNTSVLVLNGIYLFVKRLQDQHACAPSSAMSYPFGHQHRLSVIRLPKLLSKGFVSDGIMPSHDHQARNTSTSTSARAEQYHDFYNNYCVHENCELKSQRRLIRLSELVKIQRVSSLLAKL